MNDLISKLFSLKNKKIIVTGAAGGLGRQAVNFLLKNKAIVIATDISKIKLNHSNLIKHENLDMTNNLDFTKLTKEIKKIKNITGLINFCGITHNKSFEEIVKVNYMCSFEILNFFSNYVIKNKIKKSSVINITSLNSELGFTKNPGYVSTKGALKMLTKSFAVDYADYGIRFNNVGPGYFLTPMTKKNYLNKAKRLERKKRIPLGRYGEPKEINGIITYLLTEASSYVTGQDFYVDGGFLAKGI